MNINIIKFECGCVGMVFLKADGTFENDFLEIKRCDRDHHDDDIFIHQAKLDSTIRPLYLSTAMIFEQADVLELFQEIGLLIRAGYDMRSMIGIIERNTRKREV